MYINKNEIIYSHVQGEKRIEALFGTSEVIWSLEWSTRKWEDNTEMRL